MLRLLTNDEIRSLTREELEKYVAVIHRYVEITEIRRVHNLFKSDIEKNGTNEEVTAQSPHPVTVQPHPFADPGRHDQ